MAVIDLNLVVANIDNVITQFNVLKVYRSTTGTLGPWIEITTLTTRIPLVADVVLYTFQDLNGDPTYFYTTTYYNTASTLESSQADPQQGAGDSALNVISVADLKQNYLFGLDLTSPNGTPFPDALFQFYIQAAVSWLEKRLDLPIRTTTYTNERHDYYVEDFRRYCFIQLDHYPVISVQSCALNLPGQSNPTYFDQTWIEVDQDTGEMNVIPNGGGTNVLALGPGSTFLPFLLHQRMVPRAFSVSYTAGFVNGVPEEIVEVVAKIASYGPLNIAGDLLGGAGIASQSIGIDGLSQSINTTSSPMFSGYGARLNIYAKEVAEQIPTLRRYYKGIGFRAG